MGKVNLAKPHKRIFAYLIDAFVVSIPLSFILVSFFGQEDAMTYSSMYGSILFLLYLMISLVLWKGKTVGKNLFHLKVKKLDGSNPDVWTVVKRYVIATIAYAFTFGIGIWVSFFMMVFRKDKRTIHDLIAGTMVVEE